MEKKDLISLKEKVLKLKEYESNLRDEYLKGLIDGNIQGPMVGEAIIDKPWLNRYSDHELSNSEANNNLYQLYLNSVVDKMGNIAAYVNCTGESYTNRQIVEMVEKAASGLVSQGIGSDSKVGIMLNGSIEEVISLLALFKIGATIKYIDYMKSVPAMKDSIDKDNLDYIVMDECFLPLNQVINEKGIKVAVANTKNEYNDDKTISFDKLYELGADQRVPTVSNPDDKICLIINSSGTTGHPKPICHTFKSISSAVNKMLATDFPLSNGNVMLKMIPSQIGLGVITSMYTGLVSGCQVVLMIAKPEAQDLIRDINDFVINFKEYAMNHHLDFTAKINIFTAPLFARGLINDDRVTDLSKVGSILAAGSKMSKAELDELDVIAKDKGCNVPICNGYGQNEMAGAITLNTNSHNINGSGGYPTKNTDILIVDKDTHEILGNNQVGLILERSDSKFDRYDNLPEATEESKFYVGGKEYFNTNDLGYFSPEGFLFITGRTTRVVIRSDFKIPLDDLEKKINGIDVIKDCAVIKGDTNDSMEEIIVFVELNDGVDRNIDINSILASYSELSPFEQPNDIVVLDKVPYMNNGKKDYKGLETEYFNERNNQKKYRK